MQRAATCMDNESLHARKNFCTLKTDRLSGFRALSFKLKVK